MAEATRTFSVKNCSGCMTPERTSSTRRGRYLRWVTLAGAHREIFVHHDANGEAFERRRVDADDRDGAVEDNCFHGGRIVC